MDRLVEHISFPIQTMHLTVPGLVSHYIIKPVHLALPSLHDYRSIEVVTPFICEAMAASSSSSPLELPIERLPSPPVNKVKAISRPELAKILNDDEHGSKLLVVEFVEPRNAACESMKPEVDRIASRFANDAVFYELDCSNFKFLTSRLKVAAVPMFLLMRNRKAANQCDIEDIVVGVRTGELQSSIEKHIGPSGSSNQDVKLIRLNGFPWMTIPLSHYRAPSYWWRY